MTRQHIAFITVSNYTFTWIRLWPVAWSLCGEMPDADAMQELPLFHCRFVTSSNLNPLPCLFFWWRMHNATNTQCHQHHSLEWAHPLVKQENPNPTSHCAHAVCAQHPLSRRMQCPQTATPSITFPFTRCTCVVDPERDRVWCHQRTLSQTPQSLQL